MSPPFRECEFNILYGEGIDKYSELLELAVEANIINKSGSWYSYNDAKIGQGEANIVSLLKTNDGFYNEIKDRVIESYNPKEIVLDEPVKSEDQEVTQEQ
jgi:recombination protein RecA